MSQQSRASIWGSADSILSHGPLRNPGGRGAVGLALGYVQSGKTTSIIALMAKAADEGYRVVIALLGVTNLLLEQNSARIESSLGVDGSRKDYRWVVMRNPRGGKHAAQLADWLGRERVVLIPVLKHAGRIGALAEVLAAVELVGVPVLVVDDEADQASLNTKVRDDDESQTYAAVGALRRALPPHLYVQYTATPYAPLLLEPGDDLRPDFVEVLQPGEGYTGGREFFVDHADLVVRPIPTMDEQAPKGLPLQLPNSLVKALGSFIAGTALLLRSGAAAAPVSMLVHSTHKNDVQARYAFLLERKVRQWRGAAAAARALADLPESVVEERARLVTAGARDLGDDEFVSAVQFVLREATLWLVNSASDVRKVDWHVAPVHVLIGGNKLDRGFTVEGLTVTYMNRPASIQIDTLEQRARAFGYRQDLLPYCQFFAGPKTLENLRATVFTEYDLRAQLEDWLDSGGSVSEWAAQVGLMLPPGTKPTRDSVLSAVSRFNAGVDWHSLRRPDLGEAARSRNERLVQDTGLLDAEYADYGRLQHRSLNLSIADVRSLLVEPWSLSSYSPGWRREDIQQFLRRLPQQDATALVTLMEQEGGGPRERKWDPELGFVNLFQGADVRRVPGQPWYPGDRNLVDFDAAPNAVALQVHRVHPRGLDQVGEVFTLALHLGRHVVVRRSS